MGGKRGKQLTGLAPAYWTGSILSSVSSELWRGALPYFSLTELSFLVYWATKAAIFSFSAVALEESSGSAVGCFSGSAAVGLLEVTRSIGDAARLVVMAAAILVIVGASLVEMGTKPGGRVAGFFFLAWGDSVSNSMSMSWSVDAELLVAASLL